MAVRARLSRYQPVYILTPAGVRPGSLVGRDDKGRARVRTRGSRIGRLMDARLIYLQLTEAEGAWDRARAYRATLAAAGAGRGLRIVDVHLSLALSEAA